VKALMTSRPISITNRSQAQRAFWRHFALLCCGTLACFALLLKPGYPAAGSIPILLDTDIGTDIDDAFAIALIAKSPELKLLAVTTVSGDTAARARLAARLLAVAGLKGVPVAAGIAGKPLPIQQTHWADGFTSPQLTCQSAVHLLYDELRRQPGKITVVAIGPLTNIAALLEQHPDAAAKIHELVMMGGAIAHGYGDQTKPAAEYNIAQDVAAAQKVFSARIPIRMAPLDVTAMLRLTAADRQRVFSHPGALDQSLAALYKLWGHETPILFDPMAVAMVIQPDLCRMRRVAIRVDNRGYTLVESRGPARVEAGIETDPERFMSFYLDRVAP
jgi:purine nucleosidase